MRKVLWQISKKAPLTECCSLFWLMTDWTLQKSKQPFKDFFSAKFGRKPYIWTWLSLLCETITCFRQYSSFNRQDDDWLHSRAQASYVVLCATMFLPSSWALGESVQITPRCIEHMYMYDEQNECLQCLLCMHLNLLGLFLVMPLFSDIKRLWALLLQ